MDKNLKITPMLKQFMGMKAQYPDCILFFRMGDFYEMFFEDAEAAAPILEIALTSRDKKKENKVPMCGVPVHAAEGYLAKLVQAGKRVAICEQVEDPREAQGLVKRDVIRVVSPGLITQDGSIGSKTNNYFACLNPLLFSKKKWGISYLDLSTGEFMATEVDSEDGAVSELLRVGPSEMLIPESIEDNILTTRLKDSFPQTMLNFRPDVWFSVDRASERLMDHFKTLSLDGFGISHLPSAVGSAGAILSYVLETQKEDIPHIREIKPYSLENHLVLDEATMRNLELLTNASDNGKYGTLLWVLDATMTPMGGRLLKRWIIYPLMDLEEIEERLESVEAFKENHTARNILRKSLRRVYDLERLLGRITLGTSTPRDFLSLKDSISQLSDIIGLLEPFQSRSSLLGIVFEKIDPLDDLQHLIEASIREDAPPQIKEGRIIKEGFNQELDELIRIQRDGRSFIAGVEAREKKRTGISSLKVGFNRVFGYYLEVSKGQIEKVPEDYLRKQTLVSAERYITPELKEVESKILNSQERRVQLEYEIFRSVRLSISKEARRIKDTAEALSTLDCLLSLAEVAENNNYVRPRMRQSGYIAIKKGRHPVVEQTMEKGKFVPNDTTINNEDSCIIIITGPNMAGKSTILRQNALISLMAQMGGFVPAEEANLCIIDQIFTRVGATDYLARGQSTFMVEMSEAANILHNATSRSLVILDEIGRGTSTYDGLAIAWAVAEFLVRKDESGVKTLFATHYHELTNLAERFTNVKNMHVAVKEWEDNIVFLRHLMDGPSNKSYGIQVAALAGVPYSVIERAKEILTVVEKSPIGSPGDISGEEVNQKARVKKVVQKALPLFEDEWNELRENILSCDLNQTTPLEALNFLSGLQEGLKNRH